MSVAPLLRIAEAAGPAVCRVPFQPAQGECLSFRIPCGSGCRSSEPARIKSGYLDLERPGHSRRSRLLTCHGVGVVLPVSNWLRCVLSSSRTIFFRFSGQDGKENEPGCTRNFQEHILRHSRPWHFLPNLSSRLVVVLVSVRSQGC